MKYILTILLILSLSLICAIQVSGTQSGVWTPADNPYELTGDVTIPTGSTLTISPGVQVNALGNFQIIAQGNLIAVATETDSIRFMSGQADQNALWKGIRLENTSVQSQFSYCRIELGQYGIASINSPVSITYCHFNRNQKGIQAYGIGSTNPAVVTIDHNLIEYSQHNGIVVAQNSNTAITNNDICHNGLTTQYYGAIQLSNQSAGGSNSPLIAFNHIHDNHKQGIIAWDVVNAGAINPDVHHNIIEHNLSGIYFRQASGVIHHNTVTENFIPGDMNSGAGIMISGATAAPFVAENEISGNYTGFYITENAIPCLGNPAINHIYSYGQNNIHDNIDANNVTHSVVLYQYTNAALNVDALDNYWDADTADEIAATITDHNDNAALGTVNFTPWLTHVVPTQLTGTLVYDGPEPLSSSIDLVSAATGHILNHWDVTANQPFSLPVEHDSLVYVLASVFTQDAIMLFGVFGGIDTPQAIQVIADVQYNVGNIPCYTSSLWRYQKVGEPQDINGHTCYPLSWGNFIYQPDSVCWLYREGPYLMLSAIQTQVNSTLTWYDLPSPLVYTKISDLSSESWTQILYWSMDNPPVFSMVTCEGATAQYSAEGFPQTVRFVKQYQGDSVNYQATNPHGDMLNIYPNDAFIWRNISVTTDDTALPLVAGNLWHGFPAALDSLNYDCYFSYTAESPSLNFYWIPAMRSGFTEQATLTLYMDNMPSTDLPLGSDSISLNLPADGLEHSYKLVAANNGDIFYESNTLTLTFVSNNEPVQPPLAMSVFPNPFSPAASPLTIKGDLAKDSTTKLSVFNIKGQLVYTAPLSKGTHQWTWDGKDSHNHHCAAGIYQIRLTNHSGWKTSHKVILLP